MSNKVKLLSIETYDTNEYKPVKYIYATEVHTINVIRQLSAKLGTFIGGPTNISGITTKLDEVKEKALSKLKDKAIKINSKLIIGLRVQVSQISTQNDGMMVVQVSGTALRKKNNNNKNNNRKSNTRQSNTRQSNNTM